MKKNVTQFGSLDKYDKGGVEVIKDNIKNYAFSNIFEVAKNSMPYERVSVARNYEYVVECLYAKGESDWFISPHDEVALIMDGLITVTFVTPNLDNDHKWQDAGASIFRDPRGKKIGHVIAEKGHMVLLPKCFCYQFQTKEQGVILIQTLKGTLTKEKWNEICLTK